MKAQRMRRPMCLAPEYVPVHSAFSLRKCYLLSFGLLREHQATPVKAGKEREETAMKARWAFHKW